MVSLPGPCKVLHPALGLVLIDVRPHVMLASYMAHFARGGVGESPGIRRCIYICAGVEPVNMQLYCCCFLSMAAVLQCRGPRGPGAGTWPKPFHICLLCVCVLFFLCVRMCVSCVPHLLLFLVTPSSL